MSALELRPRFSPIVQDEDLGVAALAELGFLTEAQRISLAQSGRSQEFMHRFGGLVKEFAECQENPFAGEQVAPDGVWRYDGSTLPSLEGQRQRLAEIFEANDFVTGRIADSQHRWGEGTFFLPSLAWLGRYYEVADPLGAGYGSLCRIIWKKFQQEVPNSVCSSLGYVLKAGKIRVNPDVRSSYRHLDFEADYHYQSGALYGMAVPVDTGGLFAGYGPRNVRLSSLQGGMLPLGFVHTLCLLMVWPERLGQDRAQRRQYTLACSADECGDGKFPPTRLHNPVYQDEDGIKTVVRLNVPGLMLDGGIVRLVSIDATCPGGAIQCMAARP